MRRDPSAPRSAVADLVALAGFARAEKVTGYYTSAVTLVEYLVKARGEKAFTTFLRDTLPQLFVRRQRAHGLVSRELNQVGGRSETEGVVGVERPLHPGTGVVAVGSRRSRR